MSDTIHKLSPEEAESQIRKIAISGSVEITEHCYDESMRNRGYDSNDIVNVLFNGRIREPPQYDEEHSNWEYRVEGNVVEGEKATVVVAIKSHDQLVCITIMPKGV